MRYRGKANRLTLIAGLLLSGLGVSAESRAAYYFADGNDSTCAKIVDTASAFTSNTQDDNCTKQAGTNPGGNIVFYSKTGVKGTAGGGDSINVGGDLTVWGNTSLKSILDMNGHKITGVSAGTLSAISTDAVNGAQLFTTNTNVQNNATALTALNSAVVAGQKYVKANGSTGKDLADAAATDPGAIAIGNGAYAGQPDKVQAYSQTAIGAGARAEQHMTVALGAYAWARADMSVAIGQQAHANADESVALGSASWTSRGAVTKLLDPLSYSKATVTTWVGEVSVGDDTNADLKRQITNVAAGTQATDAANVGQVLGVKSVVDTNAIRTAAALGGGAKVGTDGAMTAPAYTVGGISHNNVGSALSDLDGLTANNKIAITNLNTGLAGLVQQDSASKNITIARATGGDSINVAGTDGVRTISGVKDARLSDDSTDAVTGKQLHAANAMLAATSTIVAGNAAVIAAALGGGSTVGAGGVITAPTYQFGDQTFNSVGGALTNLDGRTAANTSAITNFSNGSIGLVQQNADTKAITIASATGGDHINVTGTDGVRTISGVKDARLSDDSTDAVTGKQLHATNSNVADNAVAITNLSTQLNNGSVGLVQQDAATGNLSVAKDTAGTQVSFAGKNQDGIAIARKLTDLADADLTETSSDAVTGKQLHATNGRVGVLEASTVQYDDASKASITLNKGGQAVQIRNVADGTDDADAVNVRQLKSAGVINADGSAGAVVTYTDASRGSVVLGGGMAGTLITNVRDGVIGAGSRDAVNGGQIAALRDSLQSSISGLDGRVSTLEQNGGGGSSQGGSKFNGSGSGAADEQQEQATATGTNATAAGANATASGNSTTALGANSIASADNSAAIGANSVADRANTVSVGSAGNERAIANVAAGTAATDAVNVGQLNAVSRRVDQVQADLNSLRDDVYQRLSDQERKLDKLGAMNAAMSTMTASAAGLRTDNRVAIGTGYMNGQSAIAFGYQRRVTDATTVTIGGSTSGSEYNVGVGVGIGW
ncbi:YadA-like family protein [Andreprevotia chitinilytica]|uniref:YadA-like family protein n=1 Tax=Andreprevotia chitinilytica TaxID=396808 RepID=UPI001470412A|nr:YadA-like family protein [Andreprevotia chitinilytica]